MNTIEPVQLERLVQRLADFCRYLYGSGWTLVGVASGYSLWNVEFRVGQYQVLVPVDGTLVEAPRRVNEALDVLSAVERRDATLVARDILASQTDVIRLAISPDAEPGKAPLNEAIELIDSSRELLMAAASSVDSPRAVFGPQRTYRVQDYTSEIAFSTEAGSFVVALEARVPPSEGLPPELGLEPDALFPDPRTPFERQVTARLVEATETAVSLFSEPTLRPDELRAAVERGVSANLLESLSSIGGANQSRTARGVRPLRSFSVGITWSSGRPNPGSTDNVSIDASLAPAFSVGAQYLRSTEPEPDTQITGQVVGLRDSEQGGGSVTVSAFFVARNQGRYRPVRMELDAFDYEKASRAHLERLPVVVRGDLQPRLTLEMANVREFQVLEADD